MIRATWLHVAAAGAIGSLARYVMSTALSKTTFGRMPMSVGTLVVNVLGALIFGIVVAVFASRGECDSQVRIAVTAGLLGGFTTYSAFAYETVTLIEQQRFVAAMAYAFTMLVVGVVAAGLGLALGRIWGN